MTFYRAHRTLDEIFHSLHRKTFLGHVPDRHFGGKITNLILQNVFNINGYCPLIVFTYLLDISRLI